MTAVASVVVGWSHVLRPRAWVPFVEGWSNRRPEPFVVRILAVAFALSTLVSSRSTAQRYVVGEMAEYEIRYGPIGVGSGTIGVVAVDTLRGREAYRLRLTLSGRVNLLLYKYTIRDTMESWVDTATLQSLRFSQRQLHQNKPRVKRYEIFPERSTFADGDKPEEPSVAEPLDDISLLYYARSQPLTDGSTVEIPRHFKPASNPITLKVIRRETIEAAGKKWNTVVVQPIIKTSTMFSDGEGRVWLSDDSARVIVQINAKASVGSITLRLRSYRATASVMVPGERPGKDFSGVGSRLLFGDWPRAILITGARNQRERRRGTRRARRCRRCRGWGGPEARGAPDGAAPPGVLRLSARQRGTRVAPTPR